jgi:hypothetical protein
MPNGIKNPYAPPKPSEQPEVKGSGSIRISQLISLGSIMLGISAILGTVTVLPPKDQVVNVASGLALLSGALCFLIAFHRWRQGRENS